MHQLTLINNEHLLISVFILSESTNFLFLCIIFCVFWLVCVDILCVWRSVCDGSDIVDVSSSCRTKGLWRARHWALAPQSYVQPDRTRERARPRQLWQRTIRRSDTPSLSCDCQPDDTHSSYLLALTLSLCRNAGIRRSMRESWMRNGPLGVVEFVGGC